MKLGVRHSTSLEIHISLRGQAGTYEMMFQQDFMSQEVTGAQQRKQPDGGGDYHDEESDGMNGLCM